jgi:nitrogen fixation NifU-like protein
VMDGATRTSEGANPLCGDQVTVYLKMTGDGHIADVSFQGSGCAISKSSASLMTTLLKGKTVDEANELFDRFRKVMTSGPGSDLSDEDLADLGKLGVFAGVRDYPARVKCASLAWHTVHAALQEADQVVTTE